MPSTDLKAAYDAVTELVSMGHYRRALRTVEGLCRQRPGDVYFTALRVSCLLRMSRAAEAARVTRRALRHVTVPAHRSLLVSDLADAQTQLNRIDEAIDIVRSEHAQRPDDPALVGALTHSLALAGCTREAIAVVHAAINATPPPPFSLAIAAHYGGAALRTEHAAHALDYLTRALDANPDAPAGLRAPAHTQAGHLLDRAGRYGEAFDQYARANALGRAVYNDDTPRQRVRKLVRAYAPEHFRDAPRPPPPPPDAPRPVFIVGMPRSGTTLTEQVIDAHPRAFGAGELGTINELFRDLLGDAGALDDARPDRINRRVLADAAVAYRAEIAALAGDPRPGVIIDKGLTNFWHLGFIAQAFPDARVIHCRRDPVDTCLSCYFQPLNAAHAYAFDLKTCGLYYRHYLAVMAHARVLAADPSVGLNMLEIDYADTVSDPEAQIRRILDFVGLEFHPACLRFHESGRVARTISNDQVRQPIYTSSTNRAARYAAHLGPLLEGLGDAAEAHPTGSNARTRPPATPHAPPHHPDAPTGE